MRELALHILDLTQNCLRAGATKVTIEIHENLKGFFVFKIGDNGCGMSPELVAKVRDPFVTTRTTRKVGMGIPFMDMVTEQCEGHFEINSEEGRGTQVAAYFKTDHLDRPPLGNIVESIKILLVGAPALNLEFTYYGGKGSFVFDTDQVREVLGDSCDFTNPLIYSWVEEYLQQELEQVQTLT